MNNNNEREVQRDPIRSIAQFFRDHPAIFVTLLYVQISSVGVIYMWTLFRQFGINIMDFAETNDFLLAAFKEPLAFGQSLITIIFVLFYFGYMIKRRFATRRRMRSMIGFAVVASFIVYTIAPAWLFGRVDGRKIKNGRNPKVIVELRSYSRSASSIQLEGEIHLIGTTEKFAFFYNRENKSYRIIPIVNILNIQNTPADTADISGDEGGSTNQGKHIKENSSDTESTYISTGDK